MKKFSVKRIFAIILATVMVVTSPVGGVYDLCGNPKVGKECYT
jgi:hypothetical protein